MMFRPTCKQSGKVCNQFAGVQSVKLTWLITWLGIFFLLLQFFNFGKELPCHGGHHVGRD